MQKLKVRQGLTAGIFVSVFIIGFNTVTSEEPVTTFLALTMFLSVLMGGMAGILWLLTRSRKKADG